MGKALFDILRDAEPVLILAVLLAALGFIGFLFSKLSRAALNFESCSKRIETCEKAEERIAESLKAGTSRFAELKATDDKQQERLERLLERLTNSETTFVRVETCRDCQGRFERQLGEITREIRESRAIGEETSKAILRLEAGLAERLGAVSTQLAGMRGRVGDERGA